MNDAKDIADKILNCKIYDIPDIQNLARAYLELEKHLEMRNKHFALRGKIYNESDSEITKLKEENKELKGLADFDAFSRENFNSINAKQSSEIVKLKAENEKLKKSREGLRSALKDLSLPLTRTDYTVGQLDKITCDIAENSLKADDEIMKGE